MRAWDHYGLNFSWAFWAISCVVPFPSICKLASGVVAFESILTATSRAAVLPV